MTVMNCPIAPNPEYAPSYDPVFHGPSSTHHRYPYPARPRRISDGLSCETGVMMCVDLATQSRDTICVPFQFPRCSISSPIRAMSRVVRKIGYAGWMDRVESPAFCCRSRRQSCM